LLLCVFFFCCEFFWGGLIASVFLGELGL
jgi:hypothetical protein